MFEIMSDAQERFAAVSAEIDRCTAQLRREIADFQAYLVDKISSVEQEITPLHHGMFQLEAAFREFNRMHIESVKNLHGKLHLQDKKISEIAFKLDEILRSMPPSYPVAYYPQQPVRYGYPQ
jgi:exonuclease VII small subunit